MGLFERPAYQQPAIQNAADRMLNWYLEPASPNPHLIQRPGIATLSSGQYSTTEVREVYASNQAGLLIAVVGDKLAYITESTGAKTDKFTLSTTTGAFRFAEIPGWIFGSDNDGTAYTCPTPFTTWTQITDADFLPTAFAGVLGLDQYAIWSTTTSGVWQVSKVGDPTIYTSLDRATAESSPDAIRGIGSLNNRLWIFGRDSTEQWIDRGAANFPFSRDSGASLPVGCLSPTSVVTTGPYIYWLGSTASGRPTFYRSQGGYPERITTPAIDRLLAASTNANLLLTQCTTFETRDGHTMVLVQIPSATSTPVYDERTGLWCEWQSNSASPARFCGKRHAVGPSTGNDFWATDSINGNTQVATSSSTTYADATVAFQRKRAVIVPIGQNGSRSRHLRMRVTVDENISSGTMILKSSEDAGFTFTQLGSVTLTSTNTRETAEYWALGVAEEDRIYEISTTATGRVNIVDSALQAVELSA